MSLIHKQEMSEENLAAKRSNGSMARGPVTPAGKANPTSTVFDRFSLVLESKVFIFSERYPRGQYSDE